MEPNYSWIYLLIFLIIPLARIIPRLLRRTGYGQNMPKTDTRTSTRTETGFFQEANQDNNFRESTPQEKFSTKNSEKFQKNQKSFSYDFR